MLNLNRKIKGKITLAKYNFNQEQKPEKPKQKPNVRKIIGIVLVVFCSFAFLALFTNLISFFKSFLMGVFGLFSYPIFIVLFILGIALINKKKYVMSKRYAISISLALISLLAIIDLALMHNFSGNYGDWLAYSYNHKLTAGGFLIGFITAPFRFLLFEAGAYIVFSILFIVAIGLIIDYFRFAKKYNDYKKPTKVIEKNEAPVEVLMSTKKSKRAARMAETEQPKITLDAEIEKNKVDLSAKEKLGLLNKKTVISSSNVFEKQPPIMKRDEPSIENVNSGKMSIREYLLTKPTNIDLGYYRKDVQNTEQNSNTIASNFQELKQEPKVVIQSQKPTQELFVHDDFSDFSNNTNIIRQDPNNFYEERLQSSTPKQSEQKLEVEEPQNSEEIINNLEDEVLKSINNPDKIDLDATSSTLSSSRRRERFVNLEKPQENNFEATKPSQEKQQEVVEPIKPVKQKSSFYKTPPIEIFTTESMNLNELNDDMTAKKVQLEYALETFNVPAKVIAITIGPAVTRFELEMPVGISVKKLVAHSDDIALTLAANGGIRIEAPIPGKSAVGIEVPNDKIATVGLKEIMMAPEFKNAKSPLTVALGKDISGEIKVCDIAKMPHLLVAGATNSGKSVCLNAIILSLISRNSPDDLRLILIDPKRVEFTMYNDLPHLVMPKVISETDKAVNALKYAVAEMERRFVMLQDKRCRNIGEYNDSEDVKSGAVPKMPYLVIIVDELADLMVMAKKEVEENLLRLAQKARAAGIHMVLATQRPSVDVITGLIKANFPSRITFALTSFADSKTILDQGGAEKLLGKGDMLYLPSDAPCPKRIQGCFMTGTEVYNYVEFIKDNNDYDFDANVEMSITAPKQSNVSELVDGKRENDFDELLPQALKLVIENGQASITILQRKLLIGYPRASRIVDQMETAGYISPSDGSKPRSVYMTMEEWEQKFKKD